MKNLKKLTERRNKLVKEYLKLSESNMEKEIYSDPIELKMLDDWGEMTMQIINLKNNNVQKS